MTIFNHQEHYQREPRDSSPKDVSTKVVVLGSGNPSLNPHRMGPSFAVISNGTPYFVDAGEWIWRSMARAVTHHPAVFECNMTID